MSEPGGFVGLGSAFESPERGKGHEIGDPDASQPALGRKNDPDLGVVVEENLPVPPARADWTSVVVADRDDSGQLAGSGGPGRTERHQLRTGAAGEVVDVHRWEHAAVGRSNSSAHGMDAVLVGTSVGIAVDRLAGKGDELLVLVGELVATVEDEPEAPAEVGVELQWRMALSSWPASSGARLLEAARTATS